MRTSLRHGRAGGYGEIKSVSCGAYFAPAVKSNGNIAMKEPDHEEMSAILKEVYPRVGTELRRDLWPAMLRKMDAAAPSKTPTPWYDWVLVGGLAAAVLVFPKFLLLVAYHL